MEGDDPPTTSASRDVPKAKNIRSTCIDLFHREKISLLQWKRRASRKLRYVSQKHIESVFHKGHERRDEFALFRIRVSDLRTLCAHLLVEGEIRNDYIVAHDRILNILSRRDTCSLCSLVSALITRNKDSDPNRDVFLRFYGWKFFVFMKGASGEEKFAELGRSYGEKSLLPESTFESSVPEKIDWRVVTNWIEDSPGIAKLGRHPPGFRLIDVENLCVVRAQMPCEYACLSYVWGKDTSYQATLDTIHSLEQPNSLGTWDDSKQQNRIESSDVPASVKDAILACSALGKRFLWVDRLCILQDEDEEQNPTKKEQINAMGDIYRCAFVTMVAMEGKSATHGLYGVSLDRLPRYRARIGDADFTEPVDHIDWALRDSTWNTRGWTFQEAILSPRLLFFTKHGLWYEHENMNRMKSDIQEWSFRNHSPLFQWKSSHGLLGYRTAVRMLATRKFGYEWDIINGFSGILNSLFGKDHRFGLPLEDFDFALLWSPATPSLDRESRGSAFPSWSWASVKSDKIEYAAYNHGIRLVSVASWVFLDGNEIGQVPWTREENHHDLDEIEIASTLWRHGCMVESFPRDMYFKGRLGDYARMFRENWPTKNSFFEACRGIKRENQRKLKLLERFDENQIVAGRKHGAVLGYSQTTLLTAKSNPGSRHPWEHVLCHGDEAVGSIVFQTVPELRRFRNGSTTVEVFGLSMTWDLDSRYYWYEDDSIDLGNDNMEIGLLRSTNSVKSKIVGKASMNVMVIRTSNGITHRMGIGKVYLDKWLKLERTFKAIVLQ